MGNIYIISLKHVTTSHTILINWQMQVAWFSFNYDELYII